MATSIHHRRIRIVTLIENENILDHCKANDIAIVKNEAGWWIYFVDEGGEISGYDVPFETYGSALGKAKAAAEFASE